MAVPPEISIVSMPVDQRLIPETISSVKPGFGHCLAVTEDGRVFAWGKGKQALGLRGKMEDTKQPLLVDALPSPACKSYEAVAEAVEGEEQKVYVSGGEETSSRGSKEYVTAIAAGDFHSAALTNNGRVYTWGMGSRGQLGHGGLLGYDTPRLLRGVLRRRIVAISCGYAHTCLLSDANVLYTFGAGDSGQLGHGTTECEVKPRALHSRLLNGHRLVGATCGAKHTMIWTESGRAFAFGDNSCGQLGVVTEDASLEARGISNLSSAQQRTSGVGAAQRTGSSQGSVRAGSRLTSMPGCGDGGAPPAIESVTLTFNVKRRTSPEPVWLPEGEECASASCGFVHSGIVTKSGSLFLCGLNLAGRLGLPDDFSAKMIGMPVRVYLAGEATAVLCLKRATIVSTTVGMLIFGDDNWKKYLDRWNSYRPQAQVVPHPLIAPPLPPTLHTLLPTPSPTSPSPTPLSPARSVRSRSRSTTLHTPTRRSVSSSRRASAAPPSSARTTPEPPPPKNPKASTKPSEPTRPKSGDKVKPKSKGK
eukprot:Rmarinus@m.7956